MAHSIACLAQPRRAVDEQASNALPCSSGQPPEEEPLDDLAQPLLGFLGREEGGAGGWRHGRKTGMGGTTVEPCVPIAAGERIGQSGRLSRPSGLRGT